MNLAQLEANLRAKQAEAKTLLETTMRACADHVVTPASADGSTPEVKGRLMTDAEKAAVQGKLDEAKAIKARIDGMQGDSNMLAEIDRLTSGMAQAAAEGNAHREARELRSLGQQFIADPQYRAWIKAEGHRQKGTLSPGVELQATTLDTSSGSGGPLILPDNRTGLVELLFKRLVIADLIAPGTTDSNSIAYMKEKTFTNAADTVAEGGLKPESTLVFEAATSAVRKIAHWIPVTEEMLEDFKQTASIIDSRLRLGLDLKEEDQLLNGTGIAPNILGLNALTGLSTAVVRGADSNMDAIFKQITAISTTVFVMPDGIVMNPINWQTIQLLKNAAGNYMGSGPWAPAQSPTLWGLPVAVTPSEVANSALVGAFRSSAQIFRKGGVRVESSNSHASFFVNNLVAIRAEERLALAVYREAAFGKVTGLN
jgi:HK97 family phage major capsid protein